MNSWKEKLNENRAQKQEKPDYYRYRHYRFPYFVMPNTDI